MSWKDKYWESHPEEGRHKFKLVTNKDEIRRNHEERGYWNWDPKNVKLGPWFYECETCGFTILMDKIEKPLDRWGEHCQARFLKDVVEE